MSPVPVSVEAKILQFARAFRTAARAVAFYPPAHQAVTSSLDHVAAAARAITAQGPVGLTILPDVFLVAGEPIESRETTVAELAGILHRHGIGALSLRSGANIAAWRGLFELLALPPEDVQASGGIQRRWAALGHRDPGILEVDFGEMLRGRVGGDFSEMAGVINHYLETASVGSSFVDDPCAVLLAALEGAPDEEAGVAAVVAELRTGVQLVRATQPERVDQVLRRAAEIGQHLGEGAMTCLLAQRGQADAMVGTVDVVAALVGQMSDAIIAKFLAKAMASEGRPSKRFIDAFVALVPDAVRRKRILPTAREAMAAGLAVEQHVLAGWTDLEGQLEALSDRQFVSDDYARELRSARERSADAARMMQDPPERVAGWVRTLEEPAIDELDLNLLEDLLRLESDPDQLRAVLGLVLERVDEAAERDEWSAAERAARSIAGASSGATGKLRAVTAAMLRELIDSSACGRALNALGTAAVPDAQIRFLLGVGPEAVPRIVRQWMDCQDRTVRSRFEGVVSEFGPKGREALRRMLGSADPAVRAAAIRMLAAGSGTDHLPALEALILDPYEEVRHEALRALATGTADRAHEILARGIARADGAEQAALVGQTLALGGDGVVPVLKRLVSYLDQRVVDPQVYLMVISGLRQAGGADAAAALNLVFERTSWQAPLRTLKFRSAARDALRAIDHSTRGGQS